MIRLAHPPALETIGWLIERIEHHRLRINRVHDAVVAYSSFVEVLDDYVRHHTLTMDAAAAVISYGLGSTGLRSLQAPYLAARAAEYASTEHQTRARAVFVEYGYWKLAQAMADLQEDTLSESEVKILLERYFKGGSKSDNSDRELLELAREVDLEELCHTMRRSRDARWAEPW